MISGPVEKERVPGPTLCQAEVAHKRDLDVVQLHMRVQLAGHKLNIAGLSGEDAGLAIAIRDLGPALPRLAGHVTLASLV